MNGGGSGSIGGISKLQTVESDTCPMARVDSYIGVDGSTMPRSPLQPGPGSDGEAEAAVVHEAAAPAREAPDTDTGTPTVSPRKLECDLSHLGTFDPNFGVVPINDAKQVRDTGLVLPTGQIPIGSFLSTPLGVSYLTLSSILTKVLFFPLSAMLRHRGLARESPERSCG